jgi:hypothetical protein
MSNLERQILRALRQVGQVEPTPEATRRAIGRARETIPSAPTPASHRLFWRVLMPTGIAAMVIAAVSIFSVLLVNHEANAAEALREMAQASRDYKGWIHVKQDQIPEAEQRPGAPRITGLSFHVNVNQETVVRVIEREGGRTIDWRDGKEGVAQAYNSLANELVVSKWEDAPKPGEALQELKQHKDLSPWQLTQVLMVVPTTDTLVAMVDYGCKVTRNQDATSERFELSLPNYHGPDGPPEGQPFLTAVFDQQTKRLQHCSGTINQKQKSYSFSYGTPEFRSIYDLGLPKDVKVSDHRKQTSRQAIAMLDRLDGRIGAHEKLGDYVAIETETGLGTGGRSAKRSLVIYGRSGDRRFFGRYWNLAQRKLDLEGWPTPGMKLVQSAQAELSDILFVTDGTQGWFSRDRSPLRSLKGTEVRESYLAGFSLSGALWPGRQRIDYQHQPRLAIDVQMLADGAAAGQPASIGLKVIESGWTAIMPGEGFDRMEFEWRLDPTHDDLPVRTIQRQLKRDGLAAGGETQTQYLDYAQLPGGQWYPTRWLVTVSTGTQGSGVEHRLQILPDQQLPAVWFTDPGKRFAKP